MDGEIFNIVLCFAAGGQLTQNFPQQRGVLEGLASAAGEECDVVMAGNQIQDEVVVRGHGVDTGLGIKGFGFDVGVHYLQTALEIALPRHQVAGDAVELGAGAGEQGCFRFALQFAPERIGGLGQKTEPDVGVDNAEKPGIALGTGAFVEKLELFQEQHLFAGSGPQRSHRRCSEPCGELLVGGG